MDDDANTSIEIEEWLSFYENSLKDAVLADVMEQLTLMYEAVAKQKQSRVEQIEEARRLAAEEAGEEDEEESPDAPELFDGQPMASPAES